MFSELLENVSAAFQTDPSVSNSAENGMEETQAGGTKSSLSAWEEFLSFFDKRADTLREAFQRDPVEIECQGKGSSFKQRNFARERESQPPIICGELTKQGRRFKTWHVRYFVLRDTGLLYFDDKRAYEQGQLPRGQVFFKDVVKPSGRVVDKLPVIMSYWIGGEELPFAFCLHTKECTYVLAAKSENEQTQWIECLEAAFLQFETHVQGRKALLVACRELGVRVENQEGSRVDTMLRQVLEVVEDQFEQDVFRLRMVYNKHIMFLHWKAYTKAKQRLGRNACTTTKIAEAEEEANEETHKLTSRTAMRINQQIDELISNNRIQSA